MGARSLTGPDSGSMPLATLIVSVIFTVVVISVVGLRVYAAHLRRRSYKLHDYFIFLSLLSSVAGCIATGVGLYYGGLGRHVATTDTAEQVTLLKTLSGSSVLWIVSSAAAKASVLCLLWNLFPRKSFRYAVYGVAVVVALFFIGFLIEPFVICRPYSYYWRRLYSPEGGTCGDQFKEEVIAASANMVVDLVLVILPIPVLWGLKMPTAKKIRVNIILSLGIIICGVNIARMIYTARANEEDFTYSSAVEFILAELEVWVGIVVACLPLLGPLIRTNASGKPTIPSSGFRSNTSSWASRFRLRAFTGSRGSKSASDKSTQTNCNTEKSANTTRTTSSTGWDYTVDASHIKDEVYMGQKDYQVVQMDQPARRSHAGTDHEETSTESSDNEQRYSHNIV